MDCSIVSYQSVIIPLLFYNHYFLLHLFLPFFVDVLVLVGLLDKWYDACLGWAQATNRAQIFKFGSSYLKNEPAKFFVKKLATYDPTRTIKGLNVGESFLLWIKMHKI